LMNINGIVHQPLFFYESCLNWIGLAFIFFACEFIPKKRIGDMGFIYFLWYGILRLSLEPLRDSQFSFASTYVMSGLWVALAITLLVLNHTIFVKLRQYSLVSTIKNKKLTLKTFDQTLYYLGR
jgi:phosphatidylglycerol:prolipoprotein diacylglycerol transferase